jgi:hypothetical protein
MAACRPKTGILDPFGIGPLWFLAVRRGSISVVVAAWALALVAADTRAGEDHSCGWLLMLPPPVNGTADADYRAPLSSWMQHSAHDTARECQNTLVTQGTSRPPKNMTEEQWKDLWFRARCVPANAIYPPKK